MGWVSVGQERSGDNLSMLHLSKKKNALMMTIITLFKSRVYLAELKPLGAEERTIKLSLHMGVESQIDPGPRSTLLSSLFTRTAL